MDYETAMKRYFNAKRAIDLIEAEAAEKAKPEKEKMMLLAKWMEAKALEDGLKNVPVKGVGTGYWAVSTSATVANPEAFWNFVRENQAWDLVENRASSKAVKSFIDAHNAPVPGVNFGQIQVFKIKTASLSEKDQ